MRKRCNITNNSEYSCSNIFFEKLIGLCRPFASAWPKLITCPNYLSLALDSPFQKIKHSSFRSKSFTRVWFKIVIINKSSSHTNYWFESPILRQPARPLCSQNQLPALPSLIQRLPHSLSLLSLHKKCVWKILAIWIFGLRDYNAWNLLLLFIVAEC